MRWALISALMLITAFGFADTSRFDPPDARLEQKVSLEVVHTKLEDIAASLKEQTGVDIIVGSGANDWKVSDRRLTIFVEELRLERMLSDIASLLDYRLSREGTKDEWSYRLRQDLRARQDEERLAVESKEKSDSQEPKNRLSAVDAAKEALLLSPEEALKLRDKNPMLAYLGGTESGRAFARLMSSLGDIFPGGWDSVLHDKALMVPFDTLPTNIQRDLLDTTGVLGKLIEGETGQSSEELFPFMVGISQIPDPGAPPGIGSFLFLMGVDDLQDVEKINRIYEDPLHGPPMSLIPLNSPDSFFSGILGEALLGIEEGEDPKELLERVEGKLEDTEKLRALSAQDSPTQENPPTDPRLTREVEVGHGDPHPSHETTAQAVAEEIKELSELLELPMMFESFDVLNKLLSFMKPGKQPAYNLLIAMEKAGYTWGLSEDTLQVRPKDWALLRSYEIPDSFVEFYDKLVEKQKELTLDDLAAIALALTDDQIDRTFRYRFVLPSLAQAIADPDSDILRFYGSLTASQKSALRRDAGLQLSRLSQTQWGHLSEAIASRLGRAPVTAGKVTLAEEDLRQATRHSFQISVLLDGQEQERSIEHIIFTLKGERVEAMLEIKRQAEKSEQQAGALPNHAHPDRPQAAGDDEVQE